MTENGAPRLHSVPFHEPGPCPASAPCGAPADTRERAPYKRDEFNNNEGRLLTEAARVAEKEIEQGAGELADAVGRAERSKIEAIEAVGRVERLVLEVKAAREWLASVRNRHRVDGAESRLIKRRWIGVLMWIATLAAAGYDTAFFAKTFLRMLDTAWSWIDPVSLAALLPGPLIAAGLLLCGQGLAQAVARSRAHWERKPERRRLFRRAAQEPRRNADDLPWPNWLVPLAFLLVLLLTVALWALIRARDFERADAPVRLAFALLLIVFNLTCIGLKVLHHNPYTETKKLAEKTLSDVEVHEQQAVEAATTKVAKHTEDTFNLRATLSRLKTTGRHKTDVAWETILRDRDGHGLVGELAPEFADDGDQRFAGLKVPRIRVDSWDEAATFASRLDPAAIHARLVVALDKMSQ